MNVIVFHVLPKTNIISVRMLDVEIMLGGPDVTRENSHANKLPTIDYDFPSILMDESLEFCQHFS